MRRTNVENAASSVFDDIQCLITTQIFFDPVIAVSNNDEKCGHCFEKEAIKRWMKDQQERTSIGTCPQCRAEIVLLAPALSTREKLAKAFDQDPALYNKVYFDLEHFQTVFKEACEKNKFDSLIFRHYMTLLENANIHLNEAIPALANKLEGRDLLRKKLKIVSTSSASGSEKYFFGNAEISVESLQTQLNGKSIQEWLCMTTTMEVAQEEEQKSRQAINVEAQTAYRRLQTQFSQARLFLSQGARGAATASHRISSAAVNPLLQQVVHGEENKVEDALEAIKSNNTAQLSELLSGTSTVKDYSDRTITGMTLLQAAAAAGDIEMCLMLKNYMPEEEFATQIAEIFPKSIEEQEIDQKSSAFNFDTILEAILVADTPDLDAALNKTDNGSALYCKLEEFRRQFSEFSNNEKIFNPHHLLHAFEVYNKLWDPYERDGNDRDYKKRDLFWRQIFGYIQRFLPACYAQAFSQGLYYLTKTDQPDSYRPEAFKRDLKLRCDNFSYFPLPLDSRSGLGFDFAIYARSGQALGGRRPVMGKTTSTAGSLQTFVEQKQQAFRTLRRECGAYHTASLMAGGA